MKWDVNIDLNLTVEADTIEELQDRVWASIDFIEKAPHITEAILEDFLSVEDEHGNRFDIDILAEKEATP